MADDKFATLRKDLEIKITDVFPTIGTILIVSPKDDEVQFTDHYCEWLAKTLQTTLPMGVKGMVLSQSVTNFSLLEPKKDTPEYKEGWDDAFRALEEIMGKDDESDNQDSE